MGLKRVVIAVRPRHGEVLGVCGRRQVRVPVGADASVAVLEVLQRLVGQDPVVVAMARDEPARVVLAWLDHVQVVDHDHVDRDVITAAETAGSTVVWTDASRGRGRDCGIAAVANDLSHRVRSVEASSTVEAEILGVELAVESFPQVRVVRSDSMSAIRAVVSNVVPASMGGAMRARVARVHEVVRERGVRVEHVHGHASDPGNECADRLAMAVRRHQQWGTSSAGFDQVVAGILSDFRTDGRRLEMVGVALSA